ncbi:hypothetical protein MMC13_004208 [Lambiella insularis]|nr:hypothetical protein [Lambiella insularis]
MVLRTHPTAIDTVIVGNGPSALILSYILHGHIPYYNPSNPHPDPILHNKLAQSLCLLDLNVQNLTEHFQASRLSYSTQALPINVLLDTLIRPLADTEPGSFKSCVEWQFEPRRAVRHVVLGNTAQAGGQWADNPIAASWDIGTLSYAEMLSLPGYSLAEHYRVCGKELPTDFYRPSRREIAHYFAAYPHAVKISDSIWPSSIAQKISRTSNGFYIAPQGLYCQHLVLASGTFSHLLPARPQLQPLLQLPSHTTQSEPPLLVVGSGFTAADIIISTLPKRKIIHIYKWSPEDHPSPLRACHADAYPEYAGVYRRMKLSAMRHYGQDGMFSPLRRRKSNPFFSSSEWDQSYEGLPNTYIKQVLIHGQFATVTLEDSNGRLFDREVSNLEYVIGRRGSLGYLDERLQKEVLGLSELTGDGMDQISGRSLRSRVEENLEVAPNVFITGSLTGDSLVRFAFGGCIFAATRILSATSKVASEPDSGASLTLSDTTNNNNSYYRLTNGHADLKRPRKRASMSMDMQMVSSICTT